LSLGLGLACLGRRRWWCTRLIRSVRSFICCVRLLSRAGLVRNVLFALLLALASRASLGSAGTLAVGGCMVRNITASVCQNVLRGGLVVVAIRGTSVVVVVGIVGIRASIAVCGLAC
jgi:hypothetical protein